LKTRLLGNHVVNDEEPIDKCLEELTSAIHEALAASAPKRRLPADPRPLYALVFRKKHARRKRREDSEKSREIPL
jgi:hypothetical protein